ncbi:MAG: GNAT family N-acetyltransferase, partial [Paracoccaceae bacterium]|nr:GNAT family N-acetyltransferase [Paracoccaceae bacterium]
MQMIIRPARSTDAGRTGAIMSEFIDTTDWMPRIHTRAEDIGFCASMIDRGWVSVAEVDGAVVGFLAKDAQEVNALYVANAAQGRGVGKALLDAAKQGAELLELWTFKANEGARRFYLREGFTEMHETDGTRNDEKLPDVFLQWERG